VKIRVLGAGWYGCHIASSLIADGHDVVVHEISDTIFAGASGGIPARLHQGFHYPRSRMTRAACLTHIGEFMAQYGFLTRCVPINIYAIAENHSMVDYQQYVQTLRGEVPFIEIYDPAEFGLTNVEGAVLTGERHIVTTLAQQYFEDELDGVVQFGVGPDDYEPIDFDWTIDCTFCANESAGVDRYEPCVVGIMSGSCDKAVTVMDGPFGSLYPWEEDDKLLSLSSAKWTPFSKTCKTWAEAKATLETTTEQVIEHRLFNMIGDMAEFFPAIKDEYELVGFKLSIRAMPLSGADTRLVDVAKVGPRAVRVRAGKIDAIIHAAKMVKGIIAA